MLLSNLLIKEIMKNKIYISILMVVASLFLFSSCQDLLDTKQNGVESIDTYYSTDAELKSAMASIYNLMSSMTQSHFYLNNFPSDDMYAGGKNRGANAAIETLADIEITSDNNYIRTYYQYLYQMIYRANCVLQYSTVESQFAKQSEAECHFLRAWAHMELAIHWGTPPLVDHVLTSSEYLVPNSDKAVLWQFIIDEYKTALESGDLLEKSNANDIVFNITKGYAQAMLGKAYIFNENYAEAAVVLDAIIDEGRYHLYTGTFSDVIAPPAEFNTEIIFELNAPTDPNNALSTWIFRACGWRGEQFSWANSLLDVYTTGWGQGNATKDLYDAFVAEEGEDGYRLNNTVLTYPQIVAQGVILNAGQTLEQHAGYFAYKFRYATSGLFNNNASSQQDYVYMRYAEVLLLAAEAHIQSSTGDKNKAAGYINQIRLRAQVDKNGDGNVDLVSASDPNLFQLMKNEKRLELCYEGCRYVDLIRWGDAYETLKEKSRSIPSFNAVDGLDPDFKTYTTTGFKQNRDELFPYPTEEMNVNTNLVQNPGY